MNFAGNIGLNRFLHISAEPVLQPAQARTRGRVCVGAKERKLTFLLEESQTLAAQPQQEAPARQLYTCRSEVEL